MRYEIEWSNPARRDLKKLDPTTRRRIFRLIDSLKNDPTPKGCTRIEGLKKPYWRIRQGEYRIVYVILKNELVIIMIAILKRSEVYKIIRKERS